MLKQKHTVRGHGASSNAYSKIYTDALRNAHSTL